MSLAGQLQRSALRSEVKAICRPSGEKAGELSSQSPSVSLPVGLDLWVFHELDGVQVLWLESAAH